MRRPLLAAAAAVIVGAACGGEATGPVAGDLDVTLSGVSAPRAVVLRVVGPQTGVAKPAGTSYQVAAAATGGDTLIVAVVAPRGGTLGSGTVLRVMVPDTRAASQYVVTLLQIAAPNYALQNPAQFGLAVVRP